MPVLTESILLIVFGFVVGAYGTLIGVGGGFLIVPVMLLVFRTTPQEAVGTSLAIVFLNALSGTLSYARQRRIDYRSGWKFAAATLPGAAAGAYLSSFFTSRAFGITFGLLLLGIALFLVIRPQPHAGSGRDATVAGHVRRTLVDAQGHVFVYAFDQRVGIALSFFVGFVSSLLGIGGGIVHVPALVYLLSFPTHLATATSLFILAVSSVVGSFFHWGLGHVLYMPVVLIGAGVLLGAQVGAYLSSRLQGVWIVRLFSLALLLVGLRLLIGAI
ncbi:MAG: sulfite exporter TauE/SafE family protein [Chloroflexi bacterium]|nr:sulfite exporter TauE/SafE family protein [Chloroflexota bacterium]